MTIDSTKAMSNNAAPYSDPKGINAVEDEEEELATIAVTTSGAPFAKARKVTPANRWESPACDEIYEADRQILQRKA